MPTDIMVSCHHTMRSVGSHRPILKSIGHMCSGSIVSRASHDTVDVQQTTHVLLHQPSGVV